MKIIKCNKCGRYFRVLDNSYELQKCTGCDSSDFHETIYTPNESPLNWEQIRVDAAIAAIPAAIKIVENSHTKPYHVSNKTVTTNCIAIECVNIADAIIAELKKR
jgi:hypothetical protein